MGGMEFNKIFAAILVAGIIAMLSGFVAKKLVHPHELKENAFKIEGVASVGGSAPKEKLAEPILAMIAAADVARGQKLSKACAACHSFDDGGKNGVGPNLYNIVGEAKQAKAGYKYSGVLNANGEENWTYAALNKFLWKPKKYAPGTKMNYIGIKKPEDRAAMVAWLRTLSASPAALPGATDIAAEQAELALPKEEAADVDSAIKTIKEGVSEEKQDLEKTKDKLNDLEAEISKSEAELKSQQEKVDAAKETLKDVVKDAVE
jgi:cytochrome c